MDRTYTIISHRRAWTFHMAKDARHLFTSDTHWSHGNIIKYSCRPFLNDAEKEMVQKNRYHRPSREAIDFMNRTIIDRFNEVARPQDVLWHLGDLAWNGREEAAKFLNALNCKNINFIWGNHDEWDIADLFQRRLATPERGIQQLVLPVYDQAMIIVDGSQMHVSHYPNDTWEGSHKGIPSLYAHVHGALNNRHIDNPKWALSVDVGVDSHDFYPWSLAELLALFNKRRPVWQAWRDKLKAKEDGGMKPVTKIE